MIYPGLLFSGLMADQTGNYAHSFYMTGGVLLTAFLIPMVLIFINCRKYRVHPQNVEEALPGRSTEELNTDGLTGVFSSPRA